MKKKLERYIDKYPIFITVMPLPIHSLAKYHFSLNICIGSGGERGT